MTTEEFGETLAERPFAPLTWVQVRVLSKMYHGRVRCICTAPKIAKSVGLSRQRVLEVLHELVDAVRVRRYGKRWVIVPKSDR